MPAPCGETLVGRVPVVDIRGVAAGFLLRKQVEDVKGKEQGKGEFFHVFFI